MGANHTVMKPFGGEILFTHLDKPIKNLNEYENLVKEMKLACKRTNIPVTDNPISTWKKDKNFERKGTDDDYLIGIDLGRNQTSHPDNHYFILFPKNPNTYKVISNMHDSATGFGFQQEFNGNKWIQPWLIRFVVAFPGVFELYYRGGGYNGYSGEIKYCDGRDSPVRLNAQESCGYSSSSSSD